MNGISHCHCIGCHHHNDNKGMLGAQFKVTKCNHRKNMSLVVPQYTSQERNGNIQSHQNSDAAEGRPKYNGFYYGETLFSVERNKDRPPLTYIGKMQRCMQKYLLTQARSLGYKISNKLRYYNL